MSNSNSITSGIRSEAPELAQFRGPHVAVDVVLFTVVQSEPETSDRLAFLVQRRQDGLAAGEWALPGRMVRENERLADAVKIALKEKCGVEGIEPKQLQVFDEPTRDSRGWVMSVAHVTTQKYDSVVEAISGKPHLALGFVIAQPKLKLQLPEEQKKLPFEQELIVQQGVHDLRDRYKNLPDPDYLLPNRFTMFQLRKVHEAVLGRSLDKDLFRRTMESKLEKTGQMSVGTVGKPAQLFKRKN